MAETIPSDMVAVFDKAKSQWWLYYISTDAKLKIIKGPKDGELEDAQTNPPYEHSVLKLDNVTVNKPKAGSGQLGVCDYVDKAGNAQTRVYYLDEDNILTELGWNAKDGWFKGALTTSEFEATPNSVLTTAVTEEQLKVYYRGKDKSGQARLWVAYVARNQTGWLRRPVMSF